MRPWLNIARPLKAVDAAGKEAWSTPDCPRKPPNDERFGLGHDAVDEFLYRRAIALHDDPVSGTKLDLSAHVARRAWCSRASLPLPAAIARKKSV